MGKFAKEGDFAEGGGGDAFVFYFEADSFESHDFFRVSVACFVDDAICSFSEVGARLFNFLITV